MAEYRLVKHCRLCKTRYVVDKSESKKHYCDSCQEKLNKETPEEENSNATGKKKLNKEHEQRGKRT